MMALFLLLLKSKTAKHLIEMALYQHCCVGKGFKQNWYFENLCTQLSPLKKSAAFAKQYHTVVPEISLSLLR